MNLKVIEKCVDTKEHVNDLSYVLEMLKEKKLAPEDAHLLSIIKKFEIMDNTVYLGEVAGLYPSKKYKELEHPLYKGKKIKDEFGFMTGVIVHCFDPKNETYVFQVRGSGVDAPGKIQNAAAGFGMYGEPLYETALRELKEEQEIEGILTMPSNNFLDLSLFAVNSFPQFLFGYVVEGDLSKIKNKVEDVRQIDELCMDIGEQEVSKQFVVPIKELKKVSAGIERKSRFYGPIKQSIDSFIQWYHQYLHIPFP